MGYDVGADISVFAISVFLHVLTFGKVFVKRKKFCTSEKKCNEKKKI